EVGAWGEIAMVEVWFCSGKSTWGARSHARCEISEVLKPGNFLEMAPGAQKMAPGAPVLTFCES
ncbi:hypothetical protein A2U01_0074042, partial [Trifolium medium]|nr:hypothetical protein [Trifolium medium]